MIRIITENPFWRKKGVLLARFLMGGIFLMTAYTKLHDIPATADLIIISNFPFPFFFAWTAGIFELLMGLCIITGVFFRGAVFLLGIYVIFLAFLFHSPFLWGSSPGELKFFLNYIVMFATLLYMIAHGPGNTWTLKNMRKL